jgi:BASS family bile acid:Na+ symporter
VGLVLIPLAIGLFIKARYTATLLQPVMAQTSNAALTILMVLMLMLNFDKLISVIGTGAVIVL